MQQLNLHGSDIEQKSFVLLFAGGSLEEEPRAGGRRLALEGGGRVQEVRHQVPGGARPRPQGHRPQRQRRREGALSSTLTVLVIQMNRLCINRFSLKAPFYKQT